MLRLLIKPALLFFPALFVLTLLAQFAGRLHPEGYLAFAAYRRGVATFYGVDVALGLTIRLAAVPEMNIDRIYSPDGRYYLTVESDAYTSDEELLVHVTDSSSSLTTRLLTSNAVHDRSPAWSADGTRIAYISGNINNFDLYVMDFADGRRTSEPRRVTTHPDADLAPAWSPDGTRLVFVSERDGNSELYTIDIATGITQRLTYHLALDLSPVWSPDGAYIAFVSERDGSAEIYLYVIASSEIRRLTYNSTVDLTPVWMLR